MPVWLKEKLWTEDLIRSRLGYTGELFFTEHHQSHAASAFYPSPFAKAAILTIDGAGEWATTTIGIGEGSNLKLLRKIEFPHSLGLLYSAFTYYCGFRVNSGEYKLMGLAPYGTPRYLDLIRDKLVRTAPDGSFTLNEEYFNYVSGLRMTSRKFEKLFGRPALRPDQKTDQFYMDVAASIQEFFNQHLVLVAREARRLTGCSQLAFAGGVALNCVANSRMARESGFDEIWVQPAAGDAGGALGAALYAWHAYYQGERPAPAGDAQKSSLLGPAYSDDQTEAELIRAGAVYHKVDSDQLIARTAAEIAAGKVIGWVQGRMEYGPRALGSRSILGDARSPEMQSVMNLKIKFRESFRPFAPVVLEEKAREYFDWPRPSPYMLFTAQVQPDKLVACDTAGKTGIDLLNLPRSVIPAVTHLDNSARLQTVSAAGNPLFHRLISEFDRLTGCPVIINTSFNVRGEPVVCTPTDAYRCFMGTNMDILAVGNFLVYKSEQAAMEMKEWKKTLQND
jgi:carbamoyltransferase